MSTTNGGLNIAPNGLIFYLDAANSISYVSGSTRWNDISRTQTSGSLTNGPTYNSSNGGSIAFDGVDDCVITPANTLISPTNSLSFNFWVSSTSQTAANQSILGKDTNGTNGHLLIRRFANSDTLAYNYSTGGGAVQTQSTNYFTGYNNTWINIQITANYTSTAINIYRNGVVVTSTTMATPVFPNTTAALLIGSFVSVGFLPFNGKVANTSIYNRELSAVEVLQNYNTTKTRFGL
jgi:hypothetical protein